MKMCVRVASLAIVALGLVGCASRPLESYPWAVAGEPCELVWVGVNRPNIPCVEARGVVRPTNGSEILPSYPIEVRFSSGRGGEAIFNHGPEFVLTMERRHIREAWLYNWTATVLSHEGGPVIYRTLRPQPFNPNEPIVVLVDPVP